MNRHVLAALFLVGVVLCSVPMLLLQSSGAANASLTGGFMLLFDYKIECACLLAIGGLSALLTAEMLVLMPISTLIMLLLGTLAHLQLADFPPLQGLTVGAILLFSFCMSMMKHKASIASILPIAVWAYFAGYGFMNTMQEGTRPLYFLLGALESASLLLAIGVLFTMTITGVLRASLGRLKNVAALATFFSFF